MRVRMRMTLALLRLAFCRRIDSASTQGLRACACRLALLRADMWPPLTQRLAVGVWLLRLLLIVAGTRLFVLLPV